MDLPKDPVMLLSFVNTKLRDDYSSLDELSLSLCISPDEIRNRLDAIGYSYDEELNRFV